MLVSRPHATLPAPCSDPCWRRGCAAPLPPSPPRPRPPRPPPPPAHPGVRARGRVRADARRSARRSPCPLIVLITSSVVTILGDMKLAGRNNTGQISQRFHLIRCQPDFFFAFSERGIHHAFPLINLPAGETDLPRVIWQMCRAFCQNQVRPCIINNDRNQHR